MALYPTPAGHRMAYDRDGSVGFWFGVTSSTTPTEFSTAQLQNFNSENGTNFQPFGGGGLSFYGGLLFPELRDIDGFFVTLTAASGGTISAQCQTSTSTTSGQDGTWTNQGTLLSGGGGFNSPQYPTYRTAIQSLSLTGIKGIRFLFNGNSSGGALEWPTLHVYGQPSSGQNPDSLRFYNAAGTAELTTVIDEGDIGRGVQATTQFTVKNLSSTKTATSITISAETLYDASPSLIPQFTFSTDGIHFSSSINIGTLAPGAVSPVLYVQDNVSATAQLSVWALRMVAVPATFM